MGRRDPARSRFSRQMAGFSLCLASERSGKPAPAGSVHQLWERDPSKHGSVCAGNTRTPLHPASRPSQADALAVAQMSGQPKVR